MKVKLLALYTFILIGFLSCSTSTADSRQEKSTENSESPYELFAQQLEKSIKEGNYKHLNTSWDIGLFKQKVMTNGKVDNNVLEGGEKYYRKVIFKSNNDMVDEAKQYGEFYLSRFHVENNIPKAFYTYKTDYGVNFIEFVFSKKGNEVKIVDYYNFQQGEYYSKSVFKMINNLNRYGSNSGAYTDALQLVNLAISQLNNKRKKDAWETINLVNEDLLKDNYFQSRRVVIASMVSQNTYLNAIENFIEQHPDNKKLGLYYQIILHHKRREHKQLKDTAKKMEEIVGKSELFTKWVKK